jgi:hypothetical protein
MKYNKDEDIMIIEVSPEPIDFAEEMGPFIVHFTSDSKPVLLEILDASEFFSAAVKSAMRPKENITEQNVAI